jgi:glycerol-3-phosphate dehydrogenase
MADDRPTILILGAGINGAAIARELALGGLSVCVVDAADLACGATSASSRLIHGGLRYLEYREFSLVRESLEERGRLLRLAPQFVKPLRISIPIGTRFGGLAGGMRRFLGWPREKSTARPVRRGKLLIKIGLALYDAFARGGGLPHHELHRIGPATRLPFDRSRYRWIGTYFDGQVAYPERLVVAMLEDARRLAESHGARFEVWTYHSARRSGAQFEICRGDTGEAMASLGPAAVVNATGAWLDETLRCLDVLSPPLLGGTKGSHFLTAHAGLRATIGDEGVYAEAADGRPVFVLPLGSWTLVGTTDEPYSLDPGLARASEAEIEYLLSTVNMLFPDVRLGQGDVDWHYAGVRPLPRVDERSTAAITRRHWLHEHAGRRPPTVSVVGGKLTTCRTLAEQTAALLRDRLGLPPGPNSRDRPFPGAEGYPSTRDDLSAEWATLASELALEVPQVTWLWSLVGTRLRDIARGADLASRATLGGVGVPEWFARRVIRDEWVRHVSDLIERRLMLLYDQGLSRRCLDRSAALLVDEGTCRAAEAKSQADQAQERLLNRYGRRIRQ